jgi:pilus assembly protein Flp/PilA
MKVNKKFKKLMFTIQAWARSEEGQDLVEYALVVALVAFSATSALKALGTGLNHAFSQISSTLNSSLT